MFATLVIVKKNVSCSFYSWYSWLFIIKAYYFCPNLCVSALLYITCESLHGSWFLADCLEVPTYTSEHVWVLSLIYPW